MVGRPVRVDRKNWQEGAAEVLSVQEDWITRYPEEYGIWLLHARIRNDIDDHPLFVDHAVDDRWKRWSTS